MEKEIEYDGQNENCPCVLTGNPCRTTCTCMRSHMSGGCIYCPRYGSDEQRLNHARHIIQIFAREARLVEALEHYEDPAHWSQIRNNNGNGEFLPVRYSDGNNPNAHGRDVAAIALNENIVRCSHGFDVLNDAGETIGHFDTAAEALAEYRGDK